MTEELPQYNLSEFLLTSYTSTCRQICMQIFQMAGQTNLCKGCGGLKTDYEEG
jgi:hypothetical protein